MRSLCGRIRSASNKLCRSCAGRWRTLREMNVELKDGQRLKTIVTADPTKSMPVGSRLEIETTMFQPLNVSALCRMLDWGHFDGALLALHFVTGDRHQVHGSAVVVAPGLALAAKHVIEEWLPALGEGTTVLYCHGVARSGLQLWVAREIKPIEGTDIVIIALEYGSEIPPDNRFHKAGITTRLPTIGEYVMIAGFKSTSDEFQAADNSVEITGGVLISVGEVTERYPLRRDLSMCPWPTIEINCDTLGGMSGGPAFDQHGLLDRYRACSGDFVLV